MTPASSDRYQSRLFRFVHQQSRRFTQQCDRAWRNLKFTASWVAAVGMYPLFLLLQSRRSTANQVDRAVEATLRQLPADDAVMQEESPTVDTPIRQVLLCVTGVGSGQAEETRRLGAEENNCQLPITNYQLPITNYSIKGIASQLASRNLVLVTAQNQTLDVFDPQQQAALQDRIMTAIAEYWQYRRKIGHQSQLCGANSEETTRASTHPAPVSRGGAQLAPTTPPWLTSLDHTVAEVESHHLVRVKSAAIAFYQSIFSQSTELGGSERPTADVRTEASSKTHTTTRILSLIWAAIDYFFGTDDRATVPPITNGTTRKGVSPRLKGRSIPINPQFPASRPTAKLPTSYDSADEELADPWLTARDLFGSVTQETTGDRSVTTFALPANPSTDYTFPQDRGRLRQFLSKIRAPKGIIKQQQTTPDGSSDKGLRQSNSQFIKLPNRASESILPPLSRGVGGSESLASGIRRIESRAKSAEISRTSKGKQSLRKTDPSNISTSATQNSSMQPTPDWIETPATLMGYVKHPLEQILAWLDRAMLWLEEVFLKFWQSLHKLWRKF